VKSIKVLIFRYNFDFLNPTLVTETIIKLNVGDVEIHTSVSGFWSFISIWFKVIREFKIAKGELERA